MANFDFLFHTSDRNFSGIGVVQADNEDDARAAVRAEVEAARPDVTIKEIRIEASVIMPEAHHG